MGYFVEDDREYEDQKAENKGRLHGLKFNATMRGHMAKICPITKKGTLVGGGYSNRVRATKFNPTGKVRRRANLQKKRIFVPELNRTVVVTLSTKGMRTVQKNGAYKALKKAGVI